MKTENAYDLFRAEMELTKQFAQLLVKFGMILDYMKKYNGVFHTMFQIPIDEYRNQMVKFVVLPNGCYLSHEGSYILDDNGYKYRSSVYNTSKSIAEIRRDFEKTEVSYLDKPMLFYLIYNWEWVKKQIENRLCDAEEVRKYFDTFKA